MNEVTECADSLLLDFKEFSAKRQTKEAELSKIREQLDKEFGSLNKSFSNSQKDIKNLYDTIVTLKNSVPSDEKFRLCTDENARGNPTAISLEVKLREPVALENAYPTNDIKKIEDLEELLTGVIKML